MKNFIVILLNLCLVTNILGQSEALLFADEALKGSVKSIETTIHEYHMAFGHQEEPDKSRVRHYWSFELDEAGKYTKELKRTNQKKRQEWVNRIYESEICTEKRLSLILLPNVYNKIYRYKAIPIEVNKNQQPLKVITYENDTVAIFETTYIYNSKNQLIEIQSKSELYNTYFSRSLEYNKTGFLSKISQEGNIKSFEENFKYLKFDDKGNWTERISSNSLHGKRIEARVISYF